LYFKKDKSLTSFSWSLPSAISFLIFSSAGKKRVTAWHILFFKRKERTMPGSYMPDQAKEETKELEMPGLVQEMKRQPLLL
jgi:hypothetical protein